MFHNIERSYISMLRATNYAVLCKIRRINENTFSKPRCDLKLSAMINKLVIRLKVSRSQEPINSLSQL